MNEKETAPVPDELPASTLLQFAAHPESRTGKFITEFFVVFFGCLALSLIKTWLNLNSRLVPDTLCPLTGFVLACLLRFSFRAWLPAIIGATLGPILLEMRFSLALGDATGAAIGATAGWLSMLALRQADFSLINARDLLSLIGYGAVPAGIVGASWHVALGLDPVTPRDLYPVWLAIFLGMIASITIFTPAAFFILQKDFGLPVQKERRLECMLLYLAMGVAVAASTFPSHTPTDRVVLHMLPIAVLIWTALRQGLKAVAISAAIGLIGLLILMNLKGSHSLNSQLPMAIGTFPFLCFIMITGALLLGAQHDAISASQIQTRLAMAAADFCQWEWTQQNGLKFHSHAWTQRIGLQANRFLPLERWIETVHPDDNTVFADAIVEGTKSRVPGFNVRYRSKDAQSGEWFWTKSVAVILKRDADHRPLQAVGIVVDINSDVEAEEFRIQAIYNQAELESLRNQLNPHFLFNCLNSVRALVSKDTTRARDMITSLSAMLRYLLQARSGAFETVETEMSIVLKYLNIEQIRFGTNLQVETFVAPEAKAFKIPSLIILTLVENAIKHGISKREGGGLVRVEIKTEFDALSIRVHNTGELSATDRGIGLQNTRRRLRLLASPLATFQIYSDRPNVVTASIVLPYNAIKC